MNSIYFNYIDFEIVAAFLKSESTSIASYLKEQNKQLDILNCNLINRFILL